MENVDGSLSLSIQGLRQFDQARRLAACRAFQCLPLQDPAQHFLLMCIHRLTKNGGTPSQRELAGITDRSPATVTASLKVLERQGLIRRYPDKADQRINRVELTDSGRALAGECHQRLKSLEQQMFRDFTEEELLLLSGFFRKIILNLETASPEAKEVF